MAKPFQFSIRWLMNAVTWFGAATASYMLAAKYPEEPIAVLAMLVGVAATGGSVGALFGKGLRSALYSAIVAVIVFILLNISLPVMVDT